MEPMNMTPLLEQLEDDIDEVEETLEPLLSQALSTTAQKMPVLDKAKLHVLITYTLESLLFSYLRLHGVKAKDHAVFKELTRVKQYFEKIKALETAPEKRTMTVDKDAAGRFIKHGLAGNDKADLARAEQQAKEKAMAQLRAAQLGKKKSSVPQKRPAEEQLQREEDDNSKEDEGEDEGEEDGEDDDEGGDESPNGDDGANAAQAGVMEQEVEKMIKAEGTQQSAAPGDAASGAAKSKPKTKKQMKRERKEKKKMKKQKKAARVQAKKVESKG